MAKYRKKAFVEAEPYKRGMEDGIDFFEFGSGRFICSRTKEQLKTQSYPRTSWKPYLNTLEGKLYIPTDGYICTGIKGEKWAITKEIFEATYELVEEDSIFKCPLDYNIDKCSSKEYGLTCDTCFHTNNKEK